MPTLILGVFGNHPKHRERELVTFLSLFEHIRVPSLAQKKFDFINAAFLAKATYLW